MMMTTVPPQSVGGEGGKHSLAYSKKERLNQWSHLSNQDEMGGRAFCRSFTATM
jgi:hypothetical protein